MSNVLCRYSNIFVDSCLFVQIVDKKDESIRIIHNTVKNPTKHMKIMSTTIGYIGLDLNNNKKEI